ncbi:NAD-dependent epimerase/dehydratase [bacterium]|nr:NAD-dependent epimerase/dehydratase [bacterium]
MSANILVTGGCGYLGSTLVPRLLDAGHKVTVVDNLMFDQTSLNQVCHNSNFDFVKADVRLEDEMKPLFASADIVIPLAAYVGAPLCKRDPIGAHTINNEAIKMMLRSLSKEQLVLMPTTNSAYGSGDQNNFCDETSPLNPISKYAVDKVEIEQELMEHGNAVSFRLATVFGMSPRMRLDLLVNDFTYRAVNDGFLVLFESHFKRNYIHVIDIARVFMHGIENHSSMVGEIYNVGLSEANVSKWELCEAISRQVKSFYFVEAEVGVDPDQRNYIVSNAKIEATGFKPEMSLDAGITELIKGFRMINNRKYGNV